jgi:hypothetical protein
MPARLACATTQPGSLHQHDGLRDLHRWSADDRCMDECLTHMLRPAAASEPQRQTQAHKGPQRASCSCQAAAHCSHTHWVGLVSKEVDLVKVLLDELQAVRLVPALQQHDTP